MSQRAKLFMNGQSHAIRLSSAFRFDGKEVFIRKDPTSRDIILSARPTNWDSFFTAIEGLEVAEDFLSEAERDRRVETRNPFGGLDD